MVEFENEGLRSSALALWREAFGDSEEYINFFFDNHACRCLTLCEHTELCSMLFLIEGELKGEPGYYLFAACTFKKYRGRGYMPKLLEKARQYANKSGKSFIALVPAQPWLFGYYERFGYQTSFYAKQSEPNALFDIPEGGYFKWCTAHEKYISAEGAAFGSMPAECNGMLFSVYPDGKIKIPVHKADEAYRYGMVLPVAKSFVPPNNAYIGLTLDA